MFTAHEAAKRTGATLRKIQFWDEKGYVRATLWKNRRRWTEQDLDKMKLIVKLTEKRIPLKIAAQVCAVAFKGFVYLIISGTNWELCQTAGSVVEAALLADQPVRVVEL